MAERQKLDDYKEYDEGWNLVTGFEAVRMKINYRIMNLAGSLAFQPEYGRHFEPFQLAGNVDVEMDIQNMLRDMGFETRVSITHENRISLIDLNVTI
jgi:hypothetical protein